MRSSGAPLVGMNTGYFVFVVAKYTYSAALLSNLPARRCFVLSVHAARPNVLGLRCLVSYVLIIHLGSRVWFREYSAIMQSRCQYFCASTGTASYAFCM